TEKPYLITETPEYGFSIERKEDSSSFTRWLFNFSATSYDFQNNTQWLLHLIRNKRLSYIQTTSNNEDEVEELTNAVKVADKIRALSECTNHLQQEIAFTD